MVSVATGWDMYDPRNSIKGVAAEAFLLGDCGYVGADGLLYLSDDDHDYCHGCALKAVAIGDSLVLVTHGRLRMTTDQVPGVVVMSPEEGSGVGSPPDDAGAGEIVGFAIETNLIFVHITSDSTTD